MRTVIVFVTGLAIGTAMSPLLAQGDRIPGVNNMNHVAIAYENFDEAFDFYTKKMGFKEGFTVRNAQGQPTLSYIQASRDTFIEIQPANANRTSRPQPLRAARGRFEVVCRRVEAARRDGRRGSRKA